MTQYRGIDADIITTSFPMTFAGFDSEQTITATLRYNVYEPFAVTASLAVDGAPAVQWILARDLLREGLVIPSGIGDIHIKPTPRGLLISLHSPSGYALLLAPTEPVADFVADIYTAVPDGEEDNFYSIEAELDRLAETALRSDGFDA